MAKKTLKAKKASVVKRSPSDVIAAAKADGCWPRIGRHRLWTRLKTHGHGG